MTNPDDARVEALRDLLHDICAASDAASLPIRWGRRLRPRAAQFEIACPYAVPFERLQVTAWPADDYGVVDIVLRDAPWPKQAIEQAFGPFQATTSVGPGPARVVATWHEVSLPATALLQLWWTMDGVVSITIRRDPRPAA